MKGHHIKLFSIPFGRHSYARLPFGAAFIGNMFQMKIDELCNNMPNVFAIADYILITGFDEQVKGHGKTL